MGRRGADVVGDAVPRGAGLPLPRRRLSDLQLRAHVQLVIGNELDAHAPAAEAADHLHELGQREVTTVDADERLLQVRRNGCVGQNLAPHDMPPRSPLVAFLEELELRLAYRNLRGDIVEGST